MKYLPYLILAFVFASCRSNDLDAKTHARIYCQCRIETIHKGERGRNFCAEKIDKLSRYYHYSRREFNSSLSIKDDYLLLDSSQTYLGEFYDELNRLKCRKIKGEFIYHD